jgi:NAD(P)-dependent dehydrogenase (short-subunit alcohol dehydrogenase family)
MKLGIFDEKSRLFSGKKAVVSGGTTGIGRATAIQLARWGADVLIFGRHQRELDDALEHLQRIEARVIGLTADQAELSGVARVFQRVDDELGGLDFLINNAAEDVDQLQELTDERIDYAVRQNLTGYLTCTRQALERMRPGSHIVNVGSMSAEERGAGGEVYTATKAGIRGFSESLRKTLRKRQIRVSLIEPGWVGTDMSEEPPERDAQGRGYRGRDRLLSGPTAALRPFPGAGGAAAGRVNVTSAIGRLRCRAASPSADRTRVVKVVSCLSDEKHMHCDRDARRRSF